MTNFNTLGPMMGVAGVLYLAPSFVAVVRKRPNTGTILAVNLLLGWTAIGWIVALIWALAGRERGPSSIWNTSGRKPCPSCGHSLARKARRCRYCGYTLTAKGT